MEYYFYILAENKGIDQIGLYDHKENLCQMFKVKISNENEKYVYKVSAFDNYEFTFYQIGEKFLVFYEHHIFRRTMCMIHLIELNKMCRLGRDYRKIKTKNKKLKLKE